MDLASGYSDSFNYGNGYTPLATAAINNNNNNYWANQGQVAQQAQQTQNNLFTGGGFGNMTDYYSGLGAAYGRATGGFNGSAPGWADPQPQEDPYQSWLQSGGYNAGRNQLAQQMAGSGASFNDRFSAAPAVQPGLQTQPGPYDKLPAVIRTGVDPSATAPGTSSNFNSRFGAFPDPGTPMNTPQDFPGWTAPRPAEPWYSGS